MSKHSWLILSQTDGRPLYLQIIEQIQRRVGGGDLRPGEELPSIRQLAAELRVSVITIKRAYFELERAGVIVTRQGKGSFIVDDPQVQPSVQVYELEQHLAAAAGLGQILGYSKSEMLRRLGAALDRVTGETT